MSSTNKTTNLELSQFLGSDSPKWLTDYNADMEKIDAGYQTVKAQADATDLVVGGHTSSISTLQDTTTSQGTAITGLRTDVNGNSGSINTINELLGRGEPTTSNKTIIGAINEINADLTASTGYYKVGQAVTITIAHGTKSIKTLWNELALAISNAMQNYVDGTMFNITYHTMGIHGGKWSSLSYAPFYPKTNAFVDAIFNISGSSSGCSINRCDISTTLAKNFILSYGINTTPSVTVTDESDNIADTDAVAVLLPYIPV